MSFAQLVEIALIGVALSMDTVAVAAASGAAMRKFHARNALRMAFYFGGFQAVMPLAGWAIGRSFVKYIAAYDHWAAFALLVFVGGKMIWDSFHLDPCGEPDCEPHTRHELLLLAVATSIDALAVGLSFSFLGVNVLLPALLIGAITFALSLAAYYAGSKLGHMLEGRAAALGGVILIGIGCKILYDHTHGLG